MAKSLILCDCAGSQQVDRGAIETGCGVSCSKVFTALCTAQLDHAAEALRAGDAVIACAQEQTVFMELAEELGVDSPGFVDLRDRAGWSDDAPVVGAKMAALAAEALLPAAPVPALDVVSHGTCLIFGPADVALTLAAQLGDVLAVTALITDGGDLPVERRFDVMRGRIHSVRGALGGFEVRMDAVEQLMPGGRGAFQTTPPRDGARSTCDIVLDVSGAPALVAAPHKREGYLRADPRDPLAVARLGFEAAQLVGTFEKPLYVALDETLCAHSRAGQSACSNCLDICPTGAITSNGDAVAIDPMICAGCGACAALCPSTAITYQDPPLAQLIKRMQVLASTFASAGGTTPRLLVHDAHGAEMIRLAARFGRGLPGDVIPFELEVISGFGHAEMLAALAQGFAHVDVLMAPTTETEALTRELALASAIAGDGRIALIDTPDPDHMSNVLYGAEKADVSVDPVLLLGNRRQVARLAAKALNTNAAPLDLPAGAPYGAVLVDTDACTLCLSCVSLCPSGALVDNEDMPQLRFQEDACLQCGLCANICPENAITLKPQLDLSDAALTQTVLNEEEPFACVDCGSLFGVKSTVERIMEKLSGVHPMFETSAQARMIQMCDNCRVNAQFHSEDNPFKGADKPRVRTTDDYFSKRKDH
ncbi:MAG: 4Fe-4S binding protein [Sedimentitalea sp.]